MHCTYSDCRPSSSTVTPIMTKFTSAVLPFVCYPSIRHFVDVYVCVHGLPALFASMLTPLHKPSHNRLGESTFMMVSLSVYCGLYCFCIYFKLYIYFVMVVVLVSICHPACWHAIDYVYPLPSSLPTETTLRRPLHPAGSWQTAGP